MEQQNDEIEVNGVKYIRKDKVLEKGSVVDSGCGCKAGSYHIGCGSSSVYVYSYGLGDGE